MNDPVTMHTGALGSVIHVLRADAETVAELAAVDWNRHFRRVCLDPVRGVITLMAPSRLHEDLTELLDRVVDVAGSAVADAVKGLRSTRLRGSGEPPGTGMKRRSGIPHVPSPRRAQPPRAREAGGASFVSCLAGCACR